MKGFIKLLARREILAFSVDAFIVVKIVLVAYESRWINDVDEVLHK